MKDINIELKDVCERIHTLIEKHNMSYGKLSEITGIPKSALHRYATGETLKIPMNRIEKIANTFSVSAAWIMGWEEEQKVVDLPPIPTYDELSQSVIDLLLILDDNDKIEIRGEIRQMLKADKYNKAEQKKQA